MLAVTINGQRQEFADGTTILAACRQLGIEVPTLCHDDRLRPSGACRLCVVEVKGSARPLTACNTPLVDRMEIRTHTPEIEDLRHTLLELLAQDYPAEAVERWPEKEFHRLLRQYGISKAELRNPKEIPSPKSEEAAGRATDIRASDFELPSGFGIRLSDFSHPYIHVNMLRCIQCYRCARICEEVQGQFVWRTWNRGDRTRIAPESSTLLTSQCVSCGACADTCPTGAIEDQSVVQHGRPTKWTRTTCPYCGVGCEMMVGVRANRIVQVKPVLNAPVNKGHLCVKGRYAFGFTHAADRITEPMIRVSHPYTGSDATREPERRFPLTPALSLGERENLAPSLEQPSTSEPTGCRVRVPPLPGGEGRGEGEPSCRIPPRGWKFVTWPEAIAFAAEHLRRIVEKYGPDSVGVLGSARGTNEENYLAQKFARVVLGTNNVDCCARVCHAPTAAAMKATFGTGAATNSFDDIEQARGFLLCGTNATENHPIVGARIKQAVLRGAKLIVIDPRKIELARYADIHLQLKPGTNVALLNAIACALVDGKLFDEAVLRERVAEWDEFRQFIQAYAPEKVAEFCGVDAQLIRPAARLYATAKPAMCFHGLGMTEHTQGTEGVMCLVNLALLTGNFGRPGSGINPLRGQNNVQGSAHMGCEPSKLTGYVGLDEGRALFEKVWQAPLPTNRGLNLMQMIDAAGAGSLKALWAIGYDVALTNPNAHATTRSLKPLEFVMVQDMFLNEVARECGSVFLPVASSFERDGTFMNSERRVQRVRKAIEAPGQVKADWEIICDLARAMGKGEFFDFHSPEEIWEEVRNVWNAGHGITYARLEHGGVQWPCPTEDHPGTTVLHTSAFASGRLAPLKRIEFKATEETTSREYPFLLTTGRTLYQFNAGTMTMRTLNTRLRPTDTLDVSVEDAERLGLRDDELVLVRSRHGEAVLPVRIDPAMKPGELFATFHTTHVFLNRVTGVERDRVVDTPEYKVTAVNLEKVTSGAAKSVFEKSMSR